VQELRNAGIEVALGGSGLLFALGLTNSVGDWDLTTDAPVDVVVETLGSKARRGPRTAPYTTSAFLQVGEHIEVLVGFAVDGVHFPTVVTGEWNDVPLGDPVVWMDAYRALGRSAKSATLQEYLRAS
jgi:hypothetical protein